MAHLRRILSKAQKKCYTISVGKLNPAKLANFMELECFVLVACPENSVIESKVSLGCTWLGSIRMPNLELGILPAYCHTV